MGEVEEEEKERQRMEDIVEKRLEIRVTPSLHTNKHSSLWCHYIYGRGGGCGSSGGGGGGPSTELPTTHLPFVFSEIKASE